MTSCPVCGSPGARSVVYGLPTSELFEDSGVVLGGCFVDGDARSSAERIILRRGVRVGGH